jgi:hypothetical protein
MATPHFRHQLHLHGAQLKRLALLACVVLLLPTVALAQRKSASKASRGKGGKVKSITVDNLPAYDERWFHPGLYFAGSASRFFIEPSQQYVDRLQQGTGVSANSISSPSFGVGLIGDARLGGPETPLILRFAPGVLFLERRVEFEPRGFSSPDSVVTQSLTSTVIQLPLLLKFQSDRRRNTRVYVIGGINPMLTANTRRNDPKIHLLRAVNSDLAVEYGVGLDLFYPLFKFAPELRFSHGLRNLLMKDGKIFSQSLQSLRSNSVTLYLNIQN